MNTATPQKKQLGVFLALCGTETPHGNFIGVRSEKSSSQVHADLSVRQPSETGNKGCAGTVRQKFVLLRCSRYSNGELATLFMESGFWMAHGPPGVWT